MATAFQADAFQNDTFQVDGGPTPTPVFWDARGGGYTEEEHRKKKEAKERLREQLRFAIEGPLPEAVVAELEEIAAPQVVDSRYVPLSERIDVEELMRRVELRLRLEEFARDLRKRIEDDDDEEYLLL